MAAVVLTSLLSPGSPYEPRARIRGGRVAAGMVFLLIPGLRWVIDQRMESAMRLFNRACLYPLVVFALVVLLAVL